MSFEKTELIYSDIRPIYNEPAVAICFVTDPNYVPYLGVSLSSLVKNNKKNLNYDILIIEDGVSCFDKKKLCGLAAEIPNISIRFVSVNSEIKTKVKDTMHINNHFTISTYYRLFLPQILPHYSKIIFLDSDTVVLTELSDLYNIDLEDCVLGATTDTALTGTLYSEMKSQKLDWVSYIKDTLGLDDPYDYFQAGVLLINLEKMRRHDFFESSLKVIQNIKKPRYLDQCILNATVKKYGFKVKKLDLQWNLEWHVIATNDSQPFSNIPEKFKLEYKEALNNPRIIHYASNLKPWDEPQLPLAEYFWKYARDTVFYEQIMYSSLNKFSQKNFSENNKQIIRFLLKAKKRRYKLYSFLTKILFFAKAKNKFNEKKRKLEKEIEKLEKSF